MSRGSGGRAATNVVRTCSPTPLSIEGNKICLNYSRINQKMRALSNVSCLRNEYDTFKIIRAQMQDFYKMTLMWHYIDNFAINCDFFFPTRGC